ncbi:MAG: hypothetical protein DSZ05_01290 [Sulfurospirillum sp.]|nr:MAG: hypothetical protein DSZ05_01290 [Sulfurospirillum sp.]
MRLDNLLTSGFDFSPEESLLKFQYKLVNSMFLAGIVIASIAAIIRIGIGNTLIASTDILLVASFVTGFLFLRKDKSLFRRVTTIQIIAVFTLFTVIAIALPENSVRLVWYPILIMMSYLVRGITVGLWTYAASIVALILFYALPYLLPDVELFNRLHFHDTELIMAILAYSTIALFHTFSTLQQQKSIASLRRANQRIKEQQNELYKQLRSYPTTKLPNALSLNEQIKLADTTSDDLSIVTLAIDDYIILADEFGADYAQKIVLKTAKILQKFTQSHISLYHVAPYQFSFLLQNSREEDALRLTKKIRKHFEHIRINIDAIEISISFSIGIAKGDCEKLVTHADTALHEAQRTGINNYKIFTEDAQRTQEQRDNIYWNSKIKEIIHQNKLKVYYQPIVDNKTEKIVKYECLIRAIDQDKIIPPYLFLQAAKTRGMLPAITRFVIDESFRLFEKSDLKFSINITEDDLHGNYLATYLEKKSHKYNISPDRVYLEVLENITAASTEEILSQFQKFKEMDFGISIDDFGAEASNFSRLLTYNADIIKIDGIFIKNLDTDENSRKIVETIVSLAQKLGARTVAEFVHNETIYKIVKELGVDYSQGYYFGAPLPDIMTQEVSLAT